MTFSFRIISIVPYNNFNGLLEDFGANPKATYIGNWKSDQFNVIYQKLYFSTFISSGCAHYELKPQLEESQQRISWDELTCREKRHQV